MALRIHGKGRVVVVAAANGQAVAGKLDSLDGRARRAGQGIAAALRDPHAGFVPASVAAACIRAVFGVLDARQRVVEALAVVVCADRSHAAVGASASARAAPLLRARGSRGRLRGGSCRGGVGVGGCVVECGE